LTEWGYKVIVSGYNKNYPVGGYIIEKDKKQLYFRTLKELKNFTKYNL
jgi:hypothetical protein